MTAAIVPLASVHRLPSRISFGPALTALKLGYKTARGHWKTEGMHLTMDATGVIMLVVEGEEQIWSPQGQTDILADDWVILDDL